MKGSITITLDNGTVLTGALEVSETRVGSAVQPLTSPLGATSSSSKKSLDYSLPLRPFMNDYSDGMSGSKKLALLVAHFAKGELDVPVDRAEAVETWNKMTGLLGGKFNGAHEARAKDSGFIYVPAPGKWALHKKWQQILL